MIQPTACLQKPRTPTPDYDGNAPPPAPAPSSPGPEAVSWSWEEALKGENPPPMKVPLQAACRVDGVGTTERLPELVDDLECHYLGFSGLTGPIRNLNKKKHVIRGLGRGSDLLRASESVYKGALLQNRGQWHPTWRQRTRPGWSRSSETEWPHQRM